MSYARLALAVFLTSAPASAQILKVDVDGGIDPITAEFIEGAVETAEAQNATLLLIRLKTPGGLGISMNDIIETILNSEVPVVCYVAPQGARAASAGFFILLSADVAAMAPGTNTGAAHPVFPFGAENETMLEKVRNDALASLRSIVTRRNRNAELAEAGVLESRSYTAQEALDGGLIDIIAASEEDLLEQLDGRRSTRLDGREIELATAGQRVELLEMTWRQQLLSTIANPNLALLLGVIGLLGLYFEFNTPGMVLPGVLGGISLLLALLGFSLLPINLIGVLLILLGLGLLAAEVKVQGFGVLGVGGIIAMTLGLLFLIDSPTPALRIEPGVALSVAFGFGIILLLLARLVFIVHHSAVQTGEAGMVGQIGRAFSDVGPAGGRVTVGGEIWRAASAGPIERGARVKVVAARNLDLKVEPADDNDATGQTEH